MVFLGHSQRLRVYWELASHIVFPVRRLTFRNTLGWMAMWLSSPWNGDIFYKHKTITIIVIISSNKFYTYIYIHYIHIHTLHCITWQDMTWHYMTLYYITWHCITLHYTTWHEITLHYIHYIHYMTLHYMTRYDMIKHYITWHCIALHYITFTLHTWK